MQLEIIRRGAVEIISEPQLIKKLETKRQLIIKAGFDPTAPDIHLGHTVLLRKLRQFQDLGHKVVFLIGDATALVGDPSGQSQARKILTWEEVEKNAHTYEKQVSKILKTDDPALFKREHNSSWFSRRGSREKEYPPFAFEQFVELAQKYTIARLLERDDFQNRLKENKPISYLELFYPLMQGYDSVKLRADVEIGGTDQKFNLLVGRDLQQAYEQEPQVVITMPLLEGTDGVQKMSKSYGNYIGINEPAADIFGKIMSISDALMMKYYELLTDEDLSAVKGMHPKEAKLRLAGIITAQYHSAAGAKKAREEFERTFSDRKIPENLPVVRITEPKNLLNLIIDNKLALSRNEARRLIQQGAVEFSGNKVESEKFNIDKSGVLKVGSRRFVKIDYA